MEYKTLRFLQQKQIILQNKTVVVAVSGGPDSVALLHFLKTYQYTWNMRLIAVTINHQLRKEAEEDVRYVEGLAKRWSLPFITEKIDVHSLAKREKISVQMAARKLRYEALAKVMEEKKADYLAFGHHADDQIETLLMSFMRTTNLSGLRGIPVRRPFHRGEIIRPLLGVTREEIERYCTKHNLSPQLDPSNEDVSYIRNYVRKFVAPPLKEKSDYLHQTVQRLSETLQEDESYLLAEAKRHFERLVQRVPSEQKVIINRQDIRRLAPPLQRRIYRLTLDYLYETVPPQLSYIHEQLFLSLLEEDVSNQQLHFPQNLTVEVVYDNLELYFNGKETKAFHTYVHDIPATVQLPNGATLHIAPTKRTVHDEKPHEFICAASEVTFPIQIRTRKPGDRMRYRGLNGSKKIKDILIDEKVPRKKREEQLLVVDYTGRILWLIGLRKGLTTEAKEETVYLSFTYKK
ncbi:MAG TPA: tRNA lysidine(34) synthetase TilS [Pseudogracilibacillus sp.]|nr:tRNA lysidine(34) synthetase TilS [Pseudogracilibacillus sp.]